MVNTTSTMAVRLRAGGRSGSNPASAFALGLFRFSLVILCAGFAISPTAVRAAILPAGHGLNLGSGAPTANGDYIPNNNGGLNTSVDYYLEVPPGLPLLQVDLFDADIGGTVDTPFGAYNTSVQWTVADPTGFIVFQQTIGVDAAFDNQWVNVVSELTPLAGHWRLSIDQSSAITAGDDANSYGFRVHDGDPTGGGTEIDAYAHSFGCFGIANAAPIDVVMYPQITSGAIWSSNEYDMDSDTGPTGFYTVTSPTGAFSQTVAAPSVNDEWLTVPHTGWDTTEYGMWRLDLHIEGQGGGNGNNFTDYYAGDYTSSPAPPTSQPEPGTFRIYFPRDDGSAPLKPYIFYELIPVSGPNPPQTGMPTTYAIRISIVNPTGHPITFGSLGAAPDEVVSTFVPAGATSYGGLQGGSPSQGTILQQPAIGGSGTILWDPGSVAGGTTATFEYLVDVTPAGANIPIQLTGDETADGTTGRFLDTSGDAGDPDNYVNFGPFAPLTVTSTADTSCEFLPLETFEFTTGSFGTYIPNLISDRATGGTPSTGAFSAIEGNPAGALAIDLANGTSTNHNGGFQSSFFMSCTTDVVVTLDYRLVMDQNFEANETSEALLQIDGGTSVVLATFTGDGNGGGDMDTGWQTYTSAPFALGAGNHTIRLGAFLNGSTEAVENVQVYYDNVSVECVTSCPPTLDVCFDFTGVTTVTAGFEARARDIDALPPTGGNNNGATEASNPQYLALSSLDGSTWETFDPGDNDEIFLEFDMTTGLDPADILNIDLRFVGYTESANNNGVTRAHEIHIFNRTSGLWEQVGADQAIAEFALTEMVRSVTSGFANYVDAATGLIQWAVTAEDSVGGGGNDAREMVVDYAEICLLINAPATPTPTPSPNPSATPSPNPTATPSANPTPTPAPPANDDCANATVVGFGTFPGDSSLPAPATQDGNSTCDAGSSPDVWFSFTPPSTGLVRISTCGTDAIAGFDSALSVHTACPGTSGNEIACNDDSSGTNCPGSPDGETVVPVTAGVPILIRVYGPGGGTGPYVLTIEPADNPTPSPDPTPTPSPDPTATPTPAPPANDDCANATVVGFGTFPGDSSLPAPATQDGDSTCDAGPAPDVWFSFTPPSTGLVRISTCGTDAIAGFDSALSVHTACPGTSGNEIACNDDSTGASCPGSPDGEIVIPVTVGVPVLIRVYGPGGGTGPYVLTIEPADNPTPTPSPDPTATPSPDPTATPTPTPSPDPTATPSVNPTPTPSPDPTVTPSANPTATPSPDATSTPTPTPSPDPTATPSVNPTATPSAVPTATATQTPIPCCPGDANHSGGFVDAADFISVQANFGASNGFCGPGDANGSGGFVDAADFISVQANFGSDCG